AAPARFSPRPRRERDFLAPLSPLGRGAGGEGFFSPLSPLGEGPGGEGFHSIHSTGQPLESKNGPAVGRNAPRPRPLSPAGRGGKDAEIPSHSVDFTRTRTLHFL